MSVLEGKNAFISGASRGIGSAIARRLAQEGAAVAIGYERSADAAAALASDFEANGGRAVAVQIGPRSITANVVHPGSTETDMNLADGPHAEVQRERMAIKRYGRAEDVAALVAFVASPEAHFVNGAELTIDGGANA